jgi:GT2 family glycosyltransferase
MGMVRESGLFDPDYYLSQYQDVKSAGVDPLQHYLTNGWIEDRNPSTCFNTEYYLDRNPDVRRVGMNPILHFIKYGRGEGRFATLTEEQVACGYKIDLFDSPADVQPEEYFVDKIQLDVLYYLHQHFEQSLHVSIINGQLNFPKTDVPTVSIVIPIYNNIDFTLRCLGSLKRNISSINYEVIIIDDNSSDGSKDLLRRIDGLRLFSNEKNIGFVGSCNRGARHARGEYVAFLNNDTMVLPGWLEELVGTFNVLPKVGLVGSMLLYPNGRLQEAGGVIWKDGSGWNYGHNDRPFKGKYLFARDVDYCSGASIMIKRQLLKEVGYFSNEYSPGYYEDTDLSFKIREHGFRTIYQPFSRVIHFEGITSGTDLSSGMKKFQVINRETFVQRWQNHIGEHLKPEEKNYYFQDRVQKKQVLIIDACTPTPDQDSGSNDTLIHMRFLQQAGFRITFVPGANLLHYGKYTEQLQRLGVECLYTPEIFSLRDYLQEEGGRYDLVWVYRWTMLDVFLDDIKQFAPRAKIVFDTVDLHFLRLQREAQLVDDEEKRREAEKVKDREIALMTEVDMTIVISDFEKKFLDETGGSGDAVIAALPMCRDIPGRQKGFAERERTIVFIGSFQHPPNIDAVTGFIKNIWPKIVAKVPDLRFQIVGSKAHEYLGPIDTENVEVVGFVDELSSILDNCLMTVAPLRYGAGVKGKTLSSMSHGVPCVMSSVACEGTSFISGQHCIVADDDDRFAETISALANDSKLWDTISHGGLKLMEEKYSLSSVENIFSDILSKLDLL